MRVLSNLLILIFSGSNFMIRCRTFYNEGCYLDESGASVIDIYGNELLATQQWLSLLFNFLIACLALFNLGSHLYDMYKKKCC